MMKTTEEKQRERLEKTAKMVAGGLIGRAALEALEANGSVSVTDLLATFIRKRESVTNEVGVATFDAIIAHLQGIAAKLP
ncbi:hypothetical protein [Nitrospirillum amazonense]|uniref:hypothetical protein n=1 Tax=Nitrospirillum amazonense TaxID=28077 RepID=UPI002412D35B|nr:hypothetical protein [Nitrospirillum amazonense]MDG3444692.1 hypothetical protein [Nitrospirillum amazonense]